MSPPYLCANEGRRAAVRAARDGDKLPILNGIDYLEIAARDPRALEVRFIHPLPGKADGVPSSGPRLGAANVIIEGGVRTRDLHVRSVRASGATLTVRASAVGDFSTYTLRLVRSPDDRRPPEGFDPALAALDFSFRAACPSDFDCATRVLAEPRPAGVAAIDYLAKDYATFRRLMLDRLSVVMPDWKERTPADMQVALVEILAYVGDALSYYQDAVATEAYLGTARRRTSMRRHARLLDYAVSEGINARAWVCLTVDPGSPSDGATLPAGTRLFTGSGAAASGEQPVSASGEAGEVFESMQAMPIGAARNAIRFYTWSDVNCCLPKGSVAATLTGADGGTAPTLGAGDALVFEEVLGPVTGLAADADSARRWAVRLTRAEALTDPLTGTAVVDVEWHPDDALPFSFCLSATVSTRDGRERIVEPTVVRGNVVLADHGVSVPAEPLTPAVVPEQGSYRPRLNRRQLTFQATSIAGSAAAVLRPDPRDAHPAIALEGDGATWTARPDLLASGPFSRDFVVEMESDGTAFLRFGDGVAGMKPSPGAAFRAAYRSGTGTSGNVGAETITRIAWTPPGISGVRNPLAAAGGTNREEIEQIRHFAPQAFRTLERAVTEADYAAIAGRNPEVQQAAAAFRWTGSWYTAFVTIDRTGGRAVDDPFANGILEQLEKYRMAGYDVEIGRAVFVPLDIAIAVCVRPGDFRSDVTQALVDAFGSGTRTDGTRGFFHPDNFTFGQPLYLSQIYRAAAQVPGVSAVNVTRFQRWGKAANRELANGSLTAAPLEILQLAGDPSFPENGRLELSVSGGL